MEVQRNCTFLQLSHCTIGKMAPNSVELWERSHKVGQKANFLHVCADLLREIRPGALNFVQHAQTRALYRRYSTYARFKGGLRSKPPGARTGSHTCDTHTYTWDVTCLMWHAHNQAEETYSIYLFSGAERQAMKKCYVSVLISVVKLSFNKMNS